MGRGLVSAVAAVAMLLVGIPFSAEPAAALSTSVVISQLYGAGGNTGAVLNADYVELFNRGSATATLTGWSIQYASATGTGNFGANSSQQADLTGTLAPGQYYLIKLASGTVGAGLPTPDLVDPTPINMAAGGGKIALVDQTTSLGCNGGSTPCTPAQMAHVIDLVGWDGANFFETTVGPTTSTTNAAFRRSGGCQETDNNGSDFALAAPAPRNTGSPLAPCPIGDVAPSVVFRSPAPGSTGVALDGNVTVGFSEAVTLGATWFSIGCATSGAHTATVSSGGTNVYILDPAANFSANELCTVTVYALEVSDLDTLDPPDNMAANDSFSFTTVDAVACGDPRTFIHTVQGSGLTSPIAGTKVDIEGIVVGAYQGTGSFSGYYIEEADADRDADPATSEGIFVFSASPAVALGDRVRVRGNVTEFTTSSGGVTSNLTELNGVTTVLKCSTGNSVTTETIALPVAALSDFERYEGMLVTFTQTLTATETFTLGRFGEVRLAAGGRLYTPTAVVAPGAPANALAQANDLRSFVLDDGNNQQNIDPTAQGYYPTGGLSASNTLRSGYTTTGVTGVFDERFGAYRVQARGPISFDASTNPRTSGPDPVGGNVKVGSANVLNFFNGDGLGGGFPTARGANTAFELGRQEAKIVSELAAIGADVFGLMEIENDSGPNSAIAELAASLNSTLGAGTYSYIDTGVIGTDQIKVALIYKPSSVTPVGPWQILTTAIDPRFIDTKNRPSLAQTFVHNTSARKFTVVVSHLKSKGSACTDVGDPDLGDGQGNCNQTRTNAAAAIVDWLNTDPTSSGSPDFLLIGDMNAYAKEDPITRFISGGYTDLVALYEGPTAYSYVFDGQSGYIDHALASTPLLGRVSGVGHWHNNADEPIVLDYNVEFKTAGQITSFYSSGPYRASDHDPVVVGLDLHDTTPPIIVAPADRGQATGPGASMCGAFIADADLGSATATDNAPGAVTITRSGVPSGNVFPVGTTTITYTATDAAGNTATATQLVTVFDDTPPTITAPANATYHLIGEVPAADPSQATASDNCGAVTVTVTESSNGGAGTPASPLILTRTYTATDTSGNTSSATQTITVIADTASVCGLVRAFVSNAGLANSLCAKLDAAAASLARGNAGAHDNQIKAFINEANAQRGKALTDANANTLISLAGGL